MENVIQLTLENFEKVLRHNTLVWFPLRQLLQTAEALEAKVWISEDKKTVFVDDADAKMPLEHPADFACSYEAIYAAASFAAWAARKAQEKVVVLNVAPPATWRSESIRRLPAMRRPDPVDEAQEKAINDEVCRLNERAVKMGNRVYRENNWVYYYRRRRLSPNAEASAYVFTLADARGPERYHKNQRWHFTTDELGEIEKTLSHDEEIYALHFGPDNEAEPGDAPVPDSKD